MTRVKRWNSQLEEIKQNIINLSICPLEKVPQYHVSVTSVLDIIIKIPHRFAVIKMFVCLEITLHKP